MLRMDMHTFSDESDGYFGISARLEEDAPGPAACGCGIRGLAGHRTRECEAGFTFNAVVLGVWGKGGWASSWLMKKTSCERRGLPLKLYF